MARILVEKSESSFAPKSFILQVYDVLARHSHKSSCSSLGLREDVSETGRFPRVKPSDQVRDVTEAGTLQNTGGD
jgi:hypothetical protein